MCFSKRKRTTPTNEAKAYTRRKTYLIQYVLLKRINMKKYINIICVCFLASGGSREPCHRFQRCKIEEPDPCSMLRIGREPRNLGTPCLKKYNKIICVNSIYYKVFLIIHHRLWRCKRIRTRPYLNTSCWMGTPEPCHRFQRCKIEEPHPLTKQSFERVPAVRSIKAIFTSLDTFVISGIRHALPIELRFTRSLGAWT